MTYWVFPDSGIDVLQRTGEVHEIEINVTESPSGVLSLSHFQNMVPAVIVVPELSCDEDFLASYQAIGDCATDTLTGFFLILIVVCTIKESVS